MSKLQVRNCTPVGNVPLCKNCSWGQFITGYRESDMLAICTATNPNSVLPFTVHECSGFQDKHRPDYEQMKKLAIDFQPLRISKTAGFRSVEPLRPVAHDDEDQDD
jgi:hypothetical protein